MATTTANGHLNPMPASPGMSTASAASSAQAGRRRQISPRAGKGIEMLGHAIDYLSDEFSLDCMGREVRVKTGTHPRVAAIELLMARNREIYFSCPIAPTLWERVRSALGLRQR